MVIFPDYYIVITYIMTLPDECLPNGIKLSKFIKYFVNVLHTFQKEKVNISIESLLYPLYKQYMYSQ